MKAVAFAGPGKMEVRDIVSEPAASRRELAFRLGAHHAVDPAQVASLQVRELTGGLGCDLAIECVGIAPTMDTALPRRAVAVGSWSRAPSSGRTL